MDRRSFLKSFVAIAGASIASATIARAAMAMPGLPDVAESQRLTAATADKQPAAPDGTAVEQAQYYWRRRRYWRPRYHWRRRYWRRRYYW